MVTWDESEKGVKIPAGKHQILLNTTSEIRDSRPYHLIVFGALLSRCISPGLGRTVSLYSNVVHLGRTALLVPSQKITSPCIALLLEVGACTSLSSFSVRFWYIRYLALGCLFLLLRDVVNTSITSHPAPLPWKRRSGYSACQPITVAMQPIKPVRHPLVSI